MSLNPKQARFVAEYLKDGNGSRAAIAAGYAPAFAKNTAWRMLHENQEIVAAIDKARKVIIDEGEYNLIRAVRETYQDLHDAKAANQHSAVAKLREMLHRLYGLLIDKHEIKIEHVDISGALAEARARVALNTTSRNITDAEIVNDEISSRLPLIE